MYIWDFNNNIKYTRNIKQLYHSIDDKPALEYINDPSLTKIWMKDGYVHRDNNKPAFTKMIDYLGFNEKVEYREYYNMGVLLRSSIVYYDDSRKAFMEVSL
jgi:hypothetical protein